MLGLCLEGSGKGGRYRLRVGGDLGVMEKTPTRCANHGVENRVSSSLHGDNNGCPFCNTINMHLPSLNGDACRFSQATTADLRSRQHGDSRSLIIVIPSKLHPMI
jgi:hypothetical protein